MDLDLLPTERFPLTTLTLIFFVFTKDAVPIADGLNGVPIATVGDLYLAFRTATLLEIELKDASADSSISSSACNFSSKILISLSIISASTNLLSDIAVSIAAFFVEIVPRSSVTVGKLLRSISILSINA